MKTKLAYITSAIVGIAFGIVSNFSFLLGSWLNLVIWAIVGILIGLFIYERKFIVWSGICYGFFLTLSFLVSGFHGSSDKLIGFTILTLILSVIGAFCGWLLVFLGNRVKNIF